jgi:AraC family transcriptional regulator
MIQQIDEAKTVTQLLAAATASFDTDRASARECIRRAAELLEVVKADSTRPAPPVVPGGLAGWQARRVAAYVEGRLGSRIRTPELASLVSLSTSHFSRAFRKTFREPPLAYVMRHRVHRAQLLMLQTRRALAQIALDCGMCDQPHFTRVFRKVIGMTPMAWRRQSSPAPSAAAESHVLMPASASRPVPHGPEIKTWSPLAYERDQLREGCAAPA